MTTQVVAVTDPFVAAIRMVMMVIASLRAAAIGMLVMVDAPAVGCSARVSGLVCVRWRQRDGQRQEHQ